MIFTDWPFTQNNSLVQYGELVSIYLQERDVPQNGSILTST